MEYVISISNVGNYHGRFIIIYDEISEFVSYSSNSHGGSASGWQIQWATNLTPALSYTNSADWFTNEPAADRVTWVRWKKQVVDINSEDGNTLKYKVIIK